MTSPRHLWSGRWQEESDAARTDAPDDIPAPAEEAPTEVAPPPQPSGGGSRSLRPVAILLAGLVLIAGGAFAVSALLEDDNASRSADGESLPASTTPAPAPKDSSVEAVSAAALPSVAAVRTTSGEGSGFLVRDNRTLVTNAHVVDGATSVTVQFGSDGRQLNGRVRGRDASSDLAVIQILDTPPSDAKPLRLADSDGLRAGQEVVAIGNPFGLAGSVTDGVDLGARALDPLALGFSIENAIQTDAAINPGNSGGPLLDTAGRVVGVNSQIETGGTSQGNVGIGFAVPSNIVRRVVPVLATGRDFEHAWLGISGPAAAASGEAAPVVNGVTAGGPASQAGLRAGDTIIAVNGKAVVAVRRRRQGDRQPPPRRQRRDQGPPRRVGADAQGHPRHEARHAAALMTFGSPEALIALVLLPLLIGWYVVQQRGRRRAQAAFVTTPMYASVVTRSSGWRRHVPLSALLLAIGLLVLAAAKPQRTIAVPAERASILLLTDVSGSMLATDVAPNRLKAAQAAAKAFVDNVPERVNVGVMAFNQVPLLLQSPTTDRAAIDEAISAMNPSGTTATGEAIQAGVRLLTGRAGAQGKRPPAAIVLLSDGASRRGVDPIEAATAAGDAKIPVYTVALGTAQGTITTPTGRVSQVPPDVESLKAISDASGGENYAAGDADRLNRVYERLGSQLGRKKEKREITSTVAGGGLALLLLGSSLSLTLLGRPI